MEDIEMMETKEKKATGNEAAADNSKLDEELEKLAKKGEKEYFKGKKGKELSEERKQRNYDIYLLATSDSPKDVRKAKECVVEDCRDYIEHEVNFLLSFSKNGSVVDADDVVQDVYIQIFKQLSTYNPDFSLLTWIQPKIVRAVMDARSKNTGVSSYYIANAKPINDAIEKLKDNGIFSPTEKDIHIMTGLSMKTIVNTLGQMNASQEKYIEDIPDGNVDSSYGSADRTMFTATPEAIFMNNEKFKKLQDALGNLTPLERQIVMQRGAHGINWQQVAINSGKEPEEVKKMYSEALKKLRISKDLADFKYGDKGNRTHFDNREIPIIPVDVANSMLDELDLVTEDDSDLEDIELEEPVLSINAAAIDTAVAVAKDEEKENNIKILAGNLMKTNPSLSEQDAMLQARALLQG